jgi:hypothetical protein
MRLIAHCFLTRDNVLEKHEENIKFVRTRIGVLRKMQQQMYYLHRPEKSAALGTRIEGYRQQLEVMYNELAKV